jgi:hypothetical protein
VRVVEHDRIVVREQLARPRLHLEFVDRGQLHISRHGHVARAADTLRDEPLAVLFPGHDHMVEEADPRFEPLCPVACAMRDVDQIGLGARQPFQDGAGPFGGDDCVKAGEQRPDGENADQLGGGESGS